MNIVKPAIFTLSITFALICILTVMGYFVGYVLVSNMSLESNNPSDIHYARFVIGFLWIAAANGIYNFIWFVGETMCYSMDRWK